MVVLSSFSTPTTHPSSAVYSRWADPASWPEWDPQVRTVAFEGPVRLGGRGRLRPASGPPVSFSVTQLQAGRVFTNTCSMPGARLTFEHVVEARDDAQAQVSVTVRLDGPLAAVWQRIVGPGMADAAPSSVRGLLAHLDLAASRRHEA